MVIVDLDEGFVEIVVNAEEFSHRFEEPSSLAGKPASNFWFGATFGELWCSW